VVYRVGALFCRGRYCVTVCSSVTCLVCCA